MESFEKSVTVKTDNATIADINKAKDALELAKVFEIDGKEMYAAAAEQVKLVKKFHSALDQKRKDFTKPLDELKKEWNAFFNPALESLKEAELLYKQAMILFDKKLEAEHREAEAKAKALADDERERLRKEQEEKEKEMREREQAALRAKKEAEKEKDAEKKKEAELKAENEARKAREYQEAAKRLSQQALLVHAPIVVQQDNKIDGISTRDSWSAEVTDFVALVNSVSEKKTPIYALMPDMKILNGLAKTLKDSFAIPGVKAVCEKIKAVRS